MVDGWVMNAAAVILFSMDWLFPVGSCDHGIGFPVNNDCWNIIYGLLYGCYAERF